MRCYGKTFRFIERTEQVTVDKSDKYQLCPKCRKPRPTTDFKSGGRRFKHCQYCRTHAKQMKELREQYGR